MATDPFGRLVRRRASAFVQNIDALESELKSVGDSYGVPVVVLITGLAAGVTAVIGVMWAVAYLTSNGGL